MSQNDIQPRSSFEDLKEKSNYLRGTIEESLANELTGGLSADDQLLIKFHGSYQQQDRDLDEERRKQKLEPLYSFLIRIRVPAGVTTAQQWLDIDALSDKYADGELKLTTRQAFQFHSVLKRNLKSTIKEINDTLLDTIAACGDVNRNVMSSSNPFETAVHAEVAEDAARISNHLTPQTRAYHEIWINKELVAGGEPESEPIYGKVYLPRKFKAAMAIPPRNDTDVFSQDLGFIAIVEGDVLKGYNLVVGGGMALTFGNEQTFPRLGDVVGYFPKEKIVEVSEAVVVFQRDHGNRSDRKNARLKYTIEKYGIDYFRAELKRTHSIVLEPEKSYKFETQGDEYGWKQGADGQWHYTLFVEGGKLTDFKGVKAKTAVREIAEFHQGTFILTGNQNLVIAQVSADDKPKIEAVLQQYGIVEADKLSKLRQYSIACAALPYCSLSFAEAERYLPVLVDRLDEILGEYGLRDAPISIRMTGCPNGCGRPFLGEIAFVGRAPGKYNMYLGAAFNGQRLNKLYREMVDETEILKELRPILKDYAENRIADERFGDFVIRKAYVKATLAGREFYA